MILRIDDTDISRNTQASLDSIFDGLNWLELGWDEQYRQSDRLVDLHRQAAEAIARKGDAYRDFTPSQADEDEKSRAGGPWLFNVGMRELSAEESSDAAGLRISHIIRGQDHLSNTFKHILILESLGAHLPQFAYLPLLVAPDGAKLSKRKHGPMVSVTTYRDAEGARLRRSARALRRRLAARRRGRGALPFFHVERFRDPGTSLLRRRFPYRAGLLEKLNKPEARPLLRELAGRLAAASEFTDASVEAELRKLADERSVKAGLLINAIGRERVIERLRSMKKAVSWQLSAISCQPYWFRLMSAQPAPPL